MQVLHSWWPLLTKKTNEEFGNAMWVLQGDNVAKNNLMILDVGITQLGNNEKQKTKRSKEEKKKNQQ